MRRPAKKNKGILAALGAVALGAAAGAAAVFLSKQENREKVGNTVKKAVRRGKSEAVKAKRKVVSVKKKYLKK